MNNVDVNNVMTPSLKLPKIFWYQRLVFLGKASFAYKHSIINNIIIIIAISAIFTICLIKNTSVSSE